MEYFPENDQKFDLYVHVILYAIGKPYRGGKNSETIHPDYSGGDLDVFFDGMWTSVGKSINWKERFSASPDCQK